MKIRVLPMEDVVSLGRIVEIQQEENDDEDGLAGPEIPYGFYATDSEGHIWFRQDSLGKLIRALLLDEPRGRGRREGS